MNEPKREAAPKFDIALVGIIVAFDPERTLLGRSAMSACPSQRTLVAGILSLKTFSRSLPHLQQGAFSVRGVGRPRESITSSNGRSVNDKRRRQSRMQFAPSHGRSLRPRGGGAERSNYSCRPSIVSNRLG
jgi:hypothetical protein